MSNPTFKFNGGKNVTNPNLFSLEQHVINNIKSFNRRYVDFLRCAGRVTQYDKTYSCDSTDTNFWVARLNHHKTNLEKSIKALEDAINNSSTTGISRQDYEKNKEIINNLNKKVLDTRKNIDSKLTELYEIGDTTTTFHQNNLVRTSYIKIMLIILASSVTFSAFMIMRNNK